MTAPLNTHELLLRVALGFIVIVLGVAGYMVDHRLISIEARLDAIRDLAVDTAKHTEANSRLLDQLGHKP